MKKIYRGLNQSVIDRALNISRIGVLFRSFGGIVVEFLILYGTAITIFLIAPDIQYSFLDMNLHPLFIAACFIGLRHGFLAGLLAAFISSMAYFFSYSYLKLDPILFFKSYEYYKFPLIFVFGGYITGRFHDSHTRKNDEMREANKEILKEYDQLEASYKKTIQMYNELKEQIVGAEYSIFSLYEIAASLQTTNPEKVYTESIGLLYKFIKARGISIYTVERGGYMRLKIHFGGKGNRNSSKKYTDSPTYQQVIETRKAVRWNPEAGNNSPIYSAPIISQDKVIGIIDIDEIEFEYISEYSFSVFQVISEWIAKALSQALEVDKQFNLMGVDYSNMLEPAQFERQLKEEQVRKEKYGLPYCEATYSIGQFDADDVVPVLQRSLRNVDYICYYKESNTIRILLPATDEENYIFVEKRLFSTLGHKLERLA